MLYLFMQCYQWVVHPKYQQSLNKSYLQQTSVNESYTVPMTSFMPAVKIKTWTLNQDLIEVEDNSFTRIYMN